MKKPTHSTLTASAATAAVALAKTIIGADRATPSTIELPQAVSEIHVGPNAVIPAGTVITEAIAAEAKLDEDDVLDLIDRGHAKIVEVFAHTAAATPAEA